VKDAHEEFKACDTDRDCVISKNELKVFLLGFFPDPSMAKALSKTLVDAWWDSIDGDGNEIVDLEEFVVFYNDIFELACRKMSNVAGVLLDGCRTARKPVSLESGLEPLELLSDTSGAVGRRPIRCAASTDEGGNA
ncbi:unnamed protein product, partial [Polarella glacialis]